MAKDVITRFKLETTGFDSKIKEAAKELSAYSKTATQAKEGFNQFTKANVDAARALGTMATSTTNVKDRVKELVGAYNDAAKAYEALTKEQQQSDWAKALAGSLTQLQQRIKETKSEMQGLGDSIKSGGIFSSLGSKMEGALAVFGGNLMTKAAGAVASLGAEMADMVKQGIEMAKAGEGVRVAFERLGNGQILQGLREATHGTVTDLELMKAAVKFNDFKLPVEELGTMLAFAQQKAKDTGQSVDYMVDSIVTGLGRKSLMILDNLGLSATEIRERMKETGDMTKAVGSIIRDQMKNAGDYVETAADRAAQANVSLQNKMEELGRKFAPLEEASNTFWTSVKISILDVVGGPLADFLNGLTEAGRRMGQLKKLQGGGNGQPTKVGRQLSALGGSDFKNEKYRSQLAQYDQDIRVAEYYKKKYQEAGWTGGSVLSDVTRRFGINATSGEDIENLISNLKVMRAEYQKGAKEIMKPVEANVKTDKAEQNVKTLTAQLNELKKQRKDAVKKGDQELVETLTKQISQTKTNLGYLDPSAAKSGTGGNKTDIKFADDSIMAQEKLISDLTQKWKTASGELRDGYLMQLDEAKDKLKEMTAVDVVPGSLQDYQNKLKDANTDVLSIREELLRMQKAGEDPVDIQVKKDELEIAIERVNSLQSDIDTLNGKTAEINIHIGIDGAPIGDTQMGEEMVNGLSTSLVNAADNLDLSGFTTALQQAMTNGLGDMGEADFSEYLEYMKEQLGDQISEQEWPTIEMAVKTGNIEELNEYIKKLQKAGTDTKEAWKGAAGSIAQLGSALQSIEDPGVKAAGTVIAAITNVALGFANASKGPFTSPWEWIAFVASGLATMITTIGTIHSLTGFANGGIYDGPSGFVPGNSFSGDNVMANGGTVSLSSGELILNRAQQGVIAQELEGGGLAGMQLETRVNAEEIIFVLNNNANRRGYKPFIND